MALNAFDAYQKATKTTAIYPEPKRFEYLVMGLCSESGEVAGKFKKILREGLPLTEERREEIKRELGDVLWYLARLSWELGYDMSEVAEENLEKLRKRKLNNTLKGNGDDR